MASLLAAVESASIDALRARRTGSEEAEIRRGDLTQPELGYLDPAGVLFVTVIERGRLSIAMTVHEPVIEDGVLVGGDALFHDHDITHQLDRLGCSDPAMVVPWLATPRLLPPNDVDLLRYELGLPVEPRQPLVLEATVVQPDDDRGRQLLADVWANPADDHPRSIYADHLQAKNDPRGELIALQLTRAPGTPPKARERALVDKCREACAQPLTRYLHSFELRRGFVARAEVDAHRHITQESIGHAAWSTVEELQCTNARVIGRAPLTSLRRLRTEGNVLLQLTFEGCPEVPAIVGLGPPYGVHTAPGRYYYAGIRLDNADHWLRICHAAWPAIRTLSVDLAHPRGGFVFALIAGSPLGERLEHLDCVVDPRSTASLDADTVHRCLGRATGLACVSLQGLFDGCPLPITLVFVRDATGAYELVLELPQVVGRDQIVALTRWIAPLGTGVERIAVHDVLDATDVGRRHRDLVTGLRALFRTVDTGSAPSHVPWAATAFDVWQA